MPRQSQMTKEVPVEEAKADATPTTATPARETPARAALKEVKSARADTGDDSAGSGPGDGKALETLEAMARANEAMLQGLAAMQSEIMEFGNARLRQNLKTQEALSHCGDLEDACRLQADFAQEAMQQYAEKTAELIELSTKIGRDCWGPFEDAAQAAMKTMTPR